MIYNIIKKGKVENMSFYKYYFSMKDMLYSTSPELPLSSFIHNIKTKHKYLLVINGERQAKVLINTNNFDHCYTHSDTPYVFYIKVKNPIEINGNIKIDTFEVDLDSKTDDVLGFLSASDLYFYCKTNNIEVINTSKVLSTKLIFSPQLANYLIERRFKSIGVKPHQNNPDRGVFVFLVEPGFYEAIAEYREKKVGKD